MKSNGEMMKNFATLKILRKFLVLTLLTTGLLFIGLSGNNVQSVQGKVKTQKHTTGPCEDACYATYQDYTQYINGQYALCDEYASANEQQCESGAYYDYDVCMDDWCPLFSNCQMFCQDRLTTAVQQCQMNYAAANSLCENQRGASQQAADSSYNSCLSSCAP